MIEIRDSGREGRPNRWTARLLADHPDHEALRADSLVAVGATEGEVLAELARTGYIKEDAGGWSYTLPEYARGPNIAPYVDHQMPGLGPV